MLKIGPDNTAELDIIPREQLWETLAAVCPWAKPAPWITANGLGDSWVDPVSNAQGPLRLEVWLAAQSIWAVLVEGKCSGFLLG